MKLFVYYAFHSIINTIKKLLKTWIGMILVIVSAMVILGLGIGFFASRFEEKAKEMVTSELEESTEEVEIPDEEFLSSKIKEEIAKRGIETMDIVDLIISLLILGFFAITVVTSKESGGGFQPADVVMLFPAPMKPQSVLLFRVMCTAGTSLMVGVIGLFQLPNLMINLGMSLFSALMLVMAYAILIMLISLLQVALFTICSKVEFLSRNRKFILPGFIFLLIAGYGAYTFFTGQDYLTSLVKFFSGEYTFFVPFWGWMRAICYYAISGNNVKSLIYFAITIAGIVLSVFGIWSMKVDFYEEAVAGAEKMARQMENAKKASLSQTQIRNKDRKAGLKREGFDKGFGANVFFHKALYNRFRFAKLKVFTVYMIVYTLVALTVAWFVRDFDKFDNFFFVGCALILCAFLRVIGNPLEEDTSKGFFVLIPESAFKKMFWSLLGNGVNVLLDIILPCVAAALLLRTNPLIIPGWILFILSVNYFGTTVGAFIGISIPGESGATIKQLVQILFIYLGIGPSAACLAAGVLLEKILLFTIIGAVFNVVVGTVFYLITPYFISNGNR